MGILKVKYFKVVRADSSKSHKTNQRARRADGLNGDLWLQFKNETKLHVLWKSGQATYNDYRYIGKLYREKIRQAKAKMNVNLAAKVNENTKCFYKYINSRRRTIQHLHPPLNTKGNLLTDDQNNTKALNAFFASILLLKTYYSLATQLPTLVHWHVEQNRPCVIYDETVSDLLQKLDASKSVGPDRSHPGLLMKWADINANLLFLVLRRSMLTENVPVVWRLANGTPNFEKEHKGDHRSCIPISLTLLPGN